MKSSGYFMKDFKKKQYDHFYITIDFNNQKT